jgi:hypothetical protein
LGSAYILGGTSEHLIAIYDKEDEELEPWRDSPGEISKDDWRDFLGKREYVLQIECGLQILKTAATGISGLLLTSSRTSLCSRAMIGRS